MDTMLDQILTRRTLYAAFERVRLTDYLLEDLHLRLNPDKTRTTSFDEGFKFLGAIFLKDAVYLPFDRPKPEFVTPRFPPPLDLITYLELKYLDTLSPSSPGEGGKGGDGRRGPG